MELGIMASFIACWLERWYEWGGVRGYHVEQEGKDLCVAVRMGHKRLWVGLDQSRSHRPDHGELAT
jgi:hypothetical protein